MEHVNKVNEIDHPSVRACLEYKNISNGLEVHYDGDLPARSGIGSSSSFTVGLLNSLSCFKGENFSKIEIARQAIHIEQEKLSEYVGVQDQIMAANGGFQEISLNKNEPWKISKMNLSRDYLKELESYILFGFSGISRLADKHAKRKIENINNNKTDQQLHRILEIAKEAKSLFNKNEDFSKIGMLLNESWIEKKKLANGVSNDYIDEIYDVAINNGAFGGKLMGAGGGGFFFFMAPPKLHNKIKKSLAKIKVWVPFKIDHEGTQIIFRNGQNGI
jgi:D-glycero-alpha-D-manno-heptose-7-phosphate kinase